MVGNERLSPYGGDGIVSPCGGDGVVLPCGGDSEVLPCGGDVEVGTVTPISAAGGKDTEIGLLLGSLVSRPTGYIGSEAGSYSSIAASSITNVVEAIELVDRVRNDCPERYYKGDMGWIEGHARTRP